MALANIQKTFAAAVDDQQCQVIALSGNWGTGKSHLWGQYKKNSKIESIQKAVYVSLFGVRTIQALKMKLLAASAEGPEGENKIGKLVTGGAGALSKILKGLHRSAEAIDDVALLTLPFVLRDAFVVLDDIERKHNLLEVDEVLGFIDEFTAKHGTRFLLILNTDQLGDKAIWEKFREKVIHHEIALDLSPDEAFDIAVASNPTTYSQALRQANKILGICNIRVLAKSIAFIERIFQNHSGLGDKVQDRFVPAAFLLCALHYKAIPDAPTIEFVLDFNSLAETAAARKYDEHESRQRWADLMERLGLFKSDHFERDVAAALRTGWIEYTTLDPAINVDQRSWQAQAAIDRVRIFAHDHTWNHKKSNAELSSEANGMLDIVEHMDVDSISALCSVVLRIEQPAIADALVQRWLATHNFTPEEASSILRGGDNHHFHPAIAEKLRDSAVQTTHWKLDLATVAQRIQNKLYSDEDERVVSSSTVDEYVRTLEALDKEEFADFVRMHLDWVRVIGHNRPWKAAGLHNFIEACVRIVEESPHTRLASILRTLVFKDARSDLRLHVRGSNGLAVDAKSA